MALQSNNLTDSGNSHHTATLANELALRQGVKSYEDQINAAQNAAANTAQRVQALQNAAQSKVNTLNWLNSKNGSDTPTTGGSGSGSGTRAVGGSSSGGGGGDYSGSSVGTPQTSLLDLLRQNYNNAVNNVNARYDLEDQQITNQNEDALRQAYINYMMSRKNADNDMARQGYTGGLTESNRARMYNNYGNIRSDLMKQRAQQLEEQRVKRNAELIQLLSNFNNQQAKYLY